MSDLKNYRQTSTYGWRTHPITGKRSFHAGIDLVKGHAEQVGSFTSGKVIHASMGKPNSGLGGYGNVVVVETPGKEAIVYAHLYNIAVEVGQGVRKGTIIGRQGATGNVTGSHLHLEVRKSSYPNYGWSAKKEVTTINPLHYFKGGGRVVKQLKVDGIQGKATNERLQQFLGVKQDGILGKESIKALQTFLNKYGQ